MKNMKKMIIVHDKYTNEPIMVQIDMISMIRTLKDERETYSSISVYGITIDIKESIDEVMNRINI
jgi:hypothetical protein